MRKKLFYLPLLPLFLFCSCVQRTEKSAQIVSMQMIDRNGFSETISAKERLEALDQIDFLSPQPYEKVMRVYGGDTSFTSIITSYHENGQPYQYLEIREGRANGLFKQWHSNGQLYIESHVIEGVPDITQAAITSFVFDKMSSIWDEQGNLVAQIYYEKGALEKSSVYFHKNGQIAKEVPYKKNLISGELKGYDETGEQIQSEQFQNGKREGKSVGYWKKGQLKFKEQYQNDLLMQAVYMSCAGKKIAQIVKGNGHRAEFEKRHLVSLIEYRKGVPDGVVKNFNAKGSLISSHTLKNGIKNGEEWEYYPTEETGGRLQHKLYLYWKEGAIVQVKTWYPNGQQESQFEMHNNKKHGHALAWYADSAMMLVEEYEKGKLVKGSYYRKGDKHRVSFVENGNGVVTLFDSDGHLLEKITYEHSLPQLHD